MNCILSGVGGQGTVLASKLIARTAIDNGLRIRTAETIGMAQRGGCVVSHVRTSAHEIASPMISLGQADIIIGFEPAEAVRCLPYLKKDGTVVVSSKAVKPVTASLSSSGYTGDEVIDYLRKNVEKLFIVDTEQLCETLDSTKVQNVALLGAALGSGALDITEEQITDAVIKSVKPQFTEINIKALKLGIESANSSNK